MECDNPIGAHERTLTNDIAGKVVVAMSGGVDSSVAALMLTQQGYPCVGVSMQVWDYRSHGGSSSRATCCAPSDFTDARRVAGKVGIPYYVLDFEEFFRKEVITRFVNSYRAGVTPNPCVDCNRKVKFKELRSRAFQFGCTHVATGHYARITQDASGFHLLRGNDPDKDQSYFLYGLTQEELASTLFPIGALTKPEVRELARAAGLVTAEKPESQDICFVSGSVKEFVERHGAVAIPGDIVTTTGKKIGAHQGVHSFTVGQRKGLGVGGSEEPMYVVELVPERNLVVVGGKAELERSQFALSDLVVVNPALRTRAETEGTFEFDAVAQLRHRHSGVPVRVRVQDGNAAVVTFQQSWATVTPGQAGVLYDLTNQEVLAGGTIVGGAAAEGASTLRVIQSA